MRRFQESGDAERALEFVLRSDGLQQTKELARSHCDAAVVQLGHLATSPYQQALVTLTHQLLHRMK